VVPAAPEPRRIASITSRVWPSWLAGNTLTSTVLCAALARSWNSTASLVLSTLVSFGPAVWMRSNLLVCAVALAANPNIRIRIKRRFMASLL